MSLGSPVCTDVFCPHELSRHPYNQRAWQTCTQHNDAPLATSSEEGSSITVGKTKQTPGVWKYYIEFLPLVNKLNSVHCQEKNAGVREASCAGFRVEPIISDSHTTSFENPVPNKTQRLPFSYHGCTNSCPIPISRRTHMNAFILIPTGAAKSNLGIPFP